MNYRIQGCRMSAALFHAVLLLVVSPSLPLAGQIQVPPNPDADGGWQASNRWMLAGALAGSAALFMMDDDIRDWFTAPALQNSGTADFVSGATSNLGGWLPLAALGGVFVAGTLAGSESVAGPALNVGGGMLTATVLTAIMKGAFGRARPSDSEDPVHEFGFGRGFRSGHPFRSFPSGHTTMAFALAAGLAAESSHRWPSAYPYVRWSAYSLATLTGLSRMYHNAHWASDVFLGAGIGLVVGRAFVHWRHQADSYGGGLSVGPGPSGSLSVNVQLPIG